MRGPGFWQPNVHFGLVSAHSCAQLVTLPGNQVSFQEVGPFDGRSRRRHLQPCRLPPIWSPACCHSSLAIGKPRPASCLWPRTASRHLISTCSGQREPRVRHQRAARGTQVPPCPRMAARRAGAARLLNVSRGRRSPARYPNCRYAHQRTRIAAVQLPRRWCCGWRSAHAARRSSTVARGTLLWTAGFGSDGPPTIRGNVELIIGTSSFKQPRVEVRDSNVGTTNHAHN